MDTVLEPSSLGGEGTTIRLSVPIELRTEFDLDYAPLASQELADRRLAMTVAILGDTWVQCLQQLLAELFSPRVDAFEPSPPPDRRQQRPTIELTADAFAHASMLDGLIQDRAGSGTGEAFEGAIAEVLMRSAAMAVFHPIASGQHESMHDANMLVAATTIDLRDAAQQLLGFSDASHRVQAQLWLHDQWHRVGSLESHARGSISLILSEALAAVLLTGLLKLGGEVYEDHRRQEKIEISLSVRSYSCVGAGVARVDVKDFHRTVEGLLPSGRTGAICAEKLALVAIGMKPGFVDDQESLDLLAARETFMKQWQIGGDPSHVSAQYASALSRAIRGEKPPK